MWKAKPKNLLVKDLLNDLQRAESAKERILMHLDKSIDAPYTIDPRPIGPTSPGMFTTAWSSFTTMPSTLPFESSIGLNTPPPLLEERQEFFYDTQTNRVIMRRHFNER